MKRNRKNYSPEFKPKTVLELLQENNHKRSGSKYDIFSKSLIERKNNS
jgi:hypothetical protein